MENLLTRHRSLSVLAAVLFLQIFGLAVQVKRSNDVEQTRLIRIWTVAAITPVERAIVHAQGGLYGIWHNYLYLRGVRQENRDLKQEIERLRLEQVRLDQDASQARRLQALLGFKEQFIIQTLPVQVVGSSGSEQSRSLYLDKGANDGLKKDMAVITADGVVGKVLQVYPHTAQVLLINDQTSGLGAIVERLRLQGIVKGSPSGETMLEKVMVDEDVQPGDRVITTGGDGIFPKGLQVGQVVKVTRSDVFLKIRIHPAADLTRLEEVLVITKLQDVASATGEVAGAQRAVDILAARLPGVPDKPDTAKVSNSQPPVSQPPVSSNPAPGLAGNSKPETRNLSAPKAPLTSPAKPPKSIKPAVATKPAVAAKPAEERTQ